MWVLLYVIMAFMTAGMLTALVFAVKTSREKKSLYCFSVLTRADEFDDVKPFIEHYRKAGVDHIFIEGNVLEGTAEGNFVTIKPSFKIGGIDSTWILEVDINELLCGMNLDMIKKMPRHTNLNIAGKILNANSSRKSKAITTIRDVVVKRKFTRKYVLGMIVDLSDEQNDEQFIQRHRTLAHIYVIGDYKTDDPNITVYSGTYSKEDVYGYARKECTWLLSVSNNMFICGDIQKRLNDYYESFEIPIYEFWNGTNILEHEHPLATDVMRTKDAQSYARVSYVPKDAKTSLNVVKVVDVQMNQYMSHCRHCGGALTTKDLIPDHTLASTIQIPQKYKFCVLLDMTSVEDISGMIENYQQQGVDHVYVAYNKLSLDASAYFGVFQELEYVTMLQISQYATIPALYPTYLRYETEWLMMTKPTDECQVGFVERIVSNADRDAFDFAGQIAFRTCKFKTLEDVPRVAEPLSGVAPIEPVTSKMDWLD